VPRGARNCNGERMTRPAILGYTGASEQRFDRATTNL
jgi:hypothetical protein